MIRDTKLIGRPTRLDTAATEFVTLRLTPEEKQTLDHWSFVYEQSRSELVRSCLDLFSYV